MSEASAAETTPVKTFGRERMAAGKYALDLEGVATAPLQQNGEQSTFIEALRKLSQAKITKMPSRFGMGDREYVTDSGTIIIKGEIWLLALLTDLVEMVRNGVDLDRASWFYYDFDWSIDADVMHTFFVVYDGKVVDETWNISSENPLALKRLQDDQPIWHSHPHFAEALDRYWYRQFYTETFAGQLMVLRPDEPVLYYYDRAPVQTRDTLRELEIVTLQKIYGLLWVGVPLLGAIAFPSIKIFMAFTAAYFVADVLWRSWATRKVG